jgi:hypothetical protein
MVDHLIRKLWGLSGALTAVLFTLALTVPAGAQAAGTASGALSQLGAVVPAPAQSAVAAALSQAPSAGGTGASEVTVPQTSVPVVSPPATPHVPVVTPPAQLQQPPTPQPPAAGRGGQSVTAAAQVISAIASVPQPDAAARALQTGSSLSSTSTRSAPAPGGRTPAHRLDRPRVHRHRGSLTSAQLASTGGVPNARAAAVRPWSPIPVFETSSRRGKQPAASARRTDSRMESRHARPAAVGRPRPGGAETTSPSLTFPLSAALPPGGAEGSAAGAGSAAAGAAAAALLALVGVCILRALLPGLLGLGLTPVQSALLVSRLERPG